jgi:hypothetical protein
MNYIDQVYDPVEKAFWEGTRNHELLIRYCELCQEPHWYPRPICPHHPHTRAVPVPPGEIIEYALRMYPFSNVCKAGHRFEPELSCNESIEEADAKLLPPDSHHLPSGRATAHKIDRDAAHPSRMVLPLIPKQHRI